ncbi:hypothetical protein MCOR25_010880 [Pyricularia grisea]|uniref:Ecp2 effector protein domain-containing protein n=1 Tax=Pyricularia grisea TaxID=148305 RepID=A0A6P8AUH2_PYRGI|nr:uncharacterized protein PgNI_08519 [Pyricularia grisea]KAI6347834.1 hypothetical protein MCOR25_010880 [Pyricularia grisea]TLD05873.1 hypothetical protein PgNI_08519 [Pyricularia grisea]
MLTRAFLLPALILWLVGAALAVTPALLYRGELRSPAKVKADGGFKALGSNRGSIETRRCVHSQNQASFSADIKAKIQNEGGNWSRDDLEWLTASTVPYTSIIAWKRVIGNVDGDWEKNPDYTGCVAVDGLQRRDLGGACATRPPAAKTPATKQSIAKQQPTRQQSTTKQQPTRQQSTRRGTTQRRPAIRQQRRR